MNTEWHQIWHHQDWPTSKSQWTLLLVERFMANNFGRVIRCKPIERSAFGLSLVNQARWTFGQTSSSVWVLATFSRQHNGTSGCVATPNYKEVSCVPKAKNSCRSLTTITEKISTTITKTRKSRQSWNFLCCWQLESDHTKKGSKATFRKLFPEKNFPHADVSAVWELVQYSWRRVWWDRSDIELDIRKVGFELVNGLL